MWEKFKNALTSVKETTGIEIPGMPDDLGSIGESATNAVQDVTGSAASALQDVTGSATGALDGAAAATETFAGTAQGAGDSAAAAVESAGQAEPDLFDQLFGASPLK
jgi:hypothetical protein